MIGICQFGAGRIGVLHAANVASHPRAKLVYVVDVNAEAAGRVAARHGAEVADAKTALADPGVDAVLIASSTDTHADLIERAARAGKKIFCEKPIDLDLARVDRCLAVVKETRADLFVGFNRRFDPSFRALREALREGRIGAPEMVVITSRDPALPSLEYLKTSGGLFRDMMIHDFDMSRWLLGEEPVEVFAWASVFADPGVAKVGDVDTAVVVMRTANGRLCQINNSRRAVFGYDQRIEVLGQNGMLRAENRSPTSLEWSGADGIVHDKPYPFFLERYADAYRAELDHFIAAVEGTQTLSVGPEDGRRALILAEAANESLRTGQPVKVR